MTQKVGKTFLHHCPGTWGLHLPGKGSPALRLAPQVDEPHLHWHVLGEETRDVQVQEAGLWGDTARSHLVFRTTGDHNAQSEVITLLRLMMSHIVNLGKGARKQLSRSEKSNVMPCQQK